MAAPRLSDAQKQDLVDRFRSGAGTQELASDFGCSPNTVIRVVKAAMEPALYEELKRLRSRRATQGPEPEPPAVESQQQPELPVQPAAAEANSAVPPADLPRPLTAAAATSEVAAADPPTDAQTEKPVSRTDDGGDADEARTLAIDDADDFEAFSDEEDEDPDDDDLIDDDLPEHAFVEVPISLGHTLDQPLNTPRPWCTDELPSSAYMLVDKTVELQALPLAEIPELGRLDTAELELQALVLYSNPRQAKRHCGRTQRVIKIPDVGLLERRAAYLLRQGIRRVVVEGALYALPEA